MAARPGETRLEHWSIRMGGGPYTAPECFAIWAVGEVYGHPSPRHPDGKMIHTTQIVAMNVEEGWLETKNTRYALGEIDPEFQKWITENGISLSRYKLCHTREASMIPRQPAMGFAGA